VASALPEGATGEQDRMRLYGGGDAIIKKFVPSQTLFFKFLFSWLDISPQKFFCGG